VRGAAVAALAAFTVCALAACSSSKPGAQPVSSTPPPTSAAPTSSSSAPTATQASPTPTPTKALSPYEADPAVKALRAWAAQVGRTVNHGKYDDAALDALMTPSMPKTMKNVAGGEIGHRYPGPLPFTPTRVTVTGSTERDVRICIVGGGYSLNPKTGKPFSAHHVQAVDAAATLSGGRWLVSQFYAGSFSCVGVQIAEPSW
jgi:hypothetical protein